LGLVPRHEQIVGEILGKDYPHTIAVLIGLSECLMAIWVLTRFKSKLNAMVQMALVATMNILEFVLVPSLLLWGRFNAVFAFVFIGIIYYNECILSKKLNLLRQK